MEWLAPTWRGGSNAANFQKRNFPSQKGALYGFPHALRRQRSRLLENAATGSRYFSKSRETGKTPILSECLCKYSVKGVYNGVAGTNLEGGLQCGQFSKKKFFEPEGGIVRLPPLLTKTKKSAFGKCSHRISLFFEIEGDR